MAPKSQKQTLALDLGQPCCLPSCYWCQHCCWAGLQNGSGCQELNLILAKIAKHHQNLLWCSTPKCEVTCKRCTENVASKEKLLMLALVFAAMGFCVWISLVHVRPNSKSNLAGLISGPNLVLALIPTTKREERWWNPLYFIFIFFVLYSMKMREESPTADEKMIRDNERVHLRLMNLNCLCDFFLDGKDEATKTSELWWCLCGQYLRCQVCLPLLSNLFLFLFSASFSFSSSLLLSSSSFG